VANTNTAVDSDLPPVAAGSAPSASPRRGATLRRILVNQQVILMLVLIILVVGFSIMNANFLTLGTAGNIFVQWAPLALIATGETFVIVSGGIDLSVGSTITISGVVAAFAMTALTTAGVGDSISIAVGVAVAALIGLTVGLVNAALINFARLVPFVATLATLGAGAGLALVLTKGGPVSGGPPSAIGLANVWLGPLSWPVIFIILIIAGSGLYLHRARFGRYTYAIGGNAFAATAAGISVRRHLTKIYALSGLFAGLAGMALYMQLGSGSPSAGSGDELQAIAAVVIGGASLTGGVGRMTGTILGAFILTVVTSGLLVINIDPNWNQVAVAVLIAAAVSLQALRSVHRRKS
jgi:ribose transport system permease protein